MSGPYRVVEKYTGLGVSYGIILDPNGNGIARDTDDEIAAALNSAHAAGVAAERARVVEWLREKVSDGHCCHRCEGSGALYADGKAHYCIERAPTVPCAVCGGSGRIVPSAEELAAELEKEQP